MIKKHYVIPALALLCVMVLLILGPIKQDQHYHNFADKRTLWNIPNFLNVVTNLPFLIVGLMGLQSAALIRVQKLKQIITTLFIGFLLLTIGSSYYHMYPQNNTLFYDRLPMVIIFMSFFSFFIYDCIDGRIGFRAFIILNAVGILSVVYWLISEKFGYGDLRWYGLVQFYPIIAIPLILILYKPPFNYWKEILPIFLFFLLAKISEQFDKELYLVLNYSVSGHSLKHLFMAIAGYITVLLTRRRFNIEL